MQTTTWFCTTCGAANDVEQTVCFACQQPHSEYTQQAERLGLLQGRYRPLTQVGVGGFGVVYKALDTQSAERVVAVKQINLRGLTPRKMIEATDAFNREVQILPQLKHPNLPRVYDHFTDPNHWYIVMEFLEGETLERYLETRLSRRFYTGTSHLLPLEEMFALAFQLCDVLDYLHAHQPPIIFRDLKPANIMRTGRGHLYLIDFGIARLFTPGQAKDTIPLGSPGYAAPEQYGKAQTTPRSDLYSLGALLHHLLTGDDPSESPFQFAPLPQTTGAGMQELDALITRLLDVDSSRRPASAREVKKELQHVAYLAASTTPRIWYPPQGQTPAPGIGLSALATGQGQQMLSQIQKQKQKGATRRKFLTHSLVGGAVLILGGAVIGPALINLFNDDGFGRGGPRPYGMRRKDSGALYRQPQTVSNITWSPDGTQAAFASNIDAVNDGNANTRSQVVVQQYSQGEEYTVYTGPSVINAVAWAPDSAHIALGNTHGYISLYDLSNVSSTLTYRGSIGAVVNMAWSPDGKLIASAGAQEVLRICRASNGQIVSTYAGNAVSETRLLTWSPDSTRVVIENDSQSGQSVSHTLQVWDAHAGKTLFTFAGVDMVNVAWAPTGKTLDSVGKDGKVYLWRASDGSLIKTYTGSDNSTTDQPWPNNLLWSPGSDYIALDNGGDVLQVWNVQNDIWEAFSIHLAHPRAAIWLAENLISFIDASQAQQVIQMNSF